VVLKVKEKADNSAFGEYIHNERTYWLFLSLSWKELLILLLQKTFANAHLLQFNPKYYFLVKMFSF
ncbi:hypothetical protein, partial [Listeria monocytogenes]|uniref:hypothetical protein n=1 Tax=Listeria monocytogenes TaxID=1639 RepID=UPI001C0D47B9